MQAMEAAEAEGGDIRGSQSAAIIVYGSEEKAHWANRVADLRVDEHTDPIKELRRLVNLRSADLSSDDAEKKAREGDATSPEVKKALDAGFAKARELSTDPSEMLFWQALVLADNHSMVAEARALLQPLFKKEPQWEELLRRLLAMESSLLDHPDVVKKIVST